MIRFWLLEIPKSKAHWLKNLYFCCFTGSYVKESYEISHVLILSIVVCVQHDNQVNPKAAIPLERLKPHNAVSLSKPYLQLLHIQEKKSKQNCLGLSHKTDRFTSLACQYYTRGKEILPEEWLIMFCLPSTTSDQIFSQELHFPESQETNFSSSQRKHLLTWKYATSNPEVLNKTLEL